MPSWLGTLAMPTSPDRLPLLEAICAFCEPELVHRWQVALNVPMPPALPIRSRYFNRSWGYDDDDWRGDLGRLRAAERKVIGDRQQLAWIEVREDFRARIASGELVLTGLQIAPSLAAARSVIPAIWARLLVFRAQNSVTAKEVRFIDVMVERIVRQPMAPTFSKEQGIAAPSEPSREMEEAAPLRRPRGRANVGPMIEEDLRTNWEEVQRLAARSPSGKPSWTTLARAVRKRLGKTHPRRQSIPHEQTIRTRLPKIYARLLSDNLVQK
ncbi:hypothetical protein [Muricoccus radiodurans]|uniref:hypothetical protein n=1 Tax=Muricoccus radiodurans TaxID=2231721 RepID=UPI003CE9ED93